jgi:5,5'-dehydrodivanillate O-demethylase
VFILHQETAQRGVEGLSTARGRIDALEGLEYREVPFGIRRQQVHKSGYVDADVMTFPNVQRVYDMFLINVPVDDTHTVRFVPVADVGLGEWWPERENEPGGTTENGQRASKSPPDAIHPVARYRMTGMGTQAQDLMALETQGPIADRTRERLATSDGGVELYRRILRREVDKVQQGIDPIGVVRDSDHAPIDTDIENWIEMTRRFPPVYTRSR